MRRARLRRIYDRGWFVEAPIVLCVCAVREEAWSRTMYDGRSHADVDAAIVMDHMTLAAADLGLGTCWIGAVRSLTRTCSATIWQNRSYP